MKFLQQIQDSIYNPGFYAKIPKQTFGTALKYFLLLILILSLIKTLDTLPGLIDVQRQAPEWVDGLVNYVPAELQVKIKDGQVSTNVEEPYFIPLDPDDEATSSGQNLLVIDTKTPFSATQFKEYNTAVWLTKDSVFYQDREENDLRAYQLSEVEDITVDRNLIKYLTSYLEPWYKLITPVLFVAVFFGLVVANAFNLVYLFILAALIWLMSQIFKWKLEYWQSYNIGIYAITLGLIIELLLDITSRWTQQDNSTFFGIPFFFTAVSLIVVFINLRTKSSSS